MFETEDPQYILGSMHDIYDSQTKKAYNHVEFNTPSGTGAFLEDNGSMMWLSSFTNKFRYEDNGYLSRVIVDERGWRYLFGDSLVHVDRLTQQEKDKGFEVNTNLLKQIIAPNKDTLTITYSTKKLISPNKRLQILVQEAKDITPQFNLNDAIIKVDTMTVSEKKIYYPIRAESSNGDYINFNYTITAGSVLLNSMTSSMGNRISLSYGVNNSATLLKQIYMTEDNNYNFNYYTPNPQDMLLVDEYGDYIDKKLYTATTAPVDLRNGLPAVLALDYIKSITYDGNWASLITTTNVGQLPNINLFESNKAENPPKSCYYMLKSIQNATGGIISYAYENSTGLIQGPFPNPFRLTTKTAQDVNGDTLSIQKYTYEGEQYFPYEEGENFYQPYIRNYIHEIPLVYPTYRMDNWDLKPHHYTLSRQFQISNVPVLPSEADEYTEAHGLYHKKVTVETRDVLGKIGKDEYFFDIPSTIKRSPQRLYVNRTMNVLGQGVIDRQSYPTWLSSIELGNIPSLAKTIHYTFEGNVFRLVSKDEYNYNLIAGNELTKVSWYINQWESADTLPESRIYSDCNIDPFLTSGLEGAKTNFRYTRKLLESVRKVNYHYNN
ncbi:hypothetical protein [Sphingobacterium siyangense]|uniref:hypothetical protein n=1 Tax=Sphingobacterium siyangense TaxID=459529 RepID=UPI002FD93E85